MLSVHDDTIVFLQITQNLKVKRAKNVILFLGDGMGFTSSTAGRWYRSQYHTEEFADDFYLPWDHFSHAGMALVSVSLFCLNNRSKPR